MSIRRFLLLPGLIRASAKGPRRQGRAWEQYWSGIGRTGPGGDVLWDVAEGAELDRIRRYAAEYLAPGLPVVDIGCGNGRFTRLLAETFPRAVGVDVADSAVRLATTESAGLPNVSFRTLDAADPAAVAALAGEIGEANVFLRGVLHINAPGARTGIAEGIATLLGDRGRVLLIETAFEGDPLAYMEYVGGTHGRIPALVRPLVRAGIRPPRRFAVPELDRTFPPRQWPRLATGPVDMHVIDQDGRESSLGIPGIFAVLRHTG